MQVLIWGLISAIWLLASLVSSSKYRDSTIDIIPALQSSGISEAQFTSSALGLDAPHVKPINASAYDWWYFDVVSADQGYSVVIIFFAAPATAFPFSGAPASDIVEAYLFVSTPEDPQLLAAPVSAGKGIVVNEGNGASGVWSGSGFSFEGAPDLSTYDVTINSPSIGVKGSISFKSSAPAHYPCTPVKAGVTMEIMPHVGWSNAVPDAVAEVDLDVNGTKMNFKGVGYHDKNWGDVPFVAAVGSWFWGHGQLGPYSIVWYDALTPTGAEYVSAYVSSSGGGIIAASCSSSSIRVRPSGAGDTYPPSLSAGPLSGNFQIKADLGSQGTMIVEVTASFHVASAEGGVYDRWTGKLTGGIKGEQSFAGTALYEQFTLVA